MKGVLALLMAALMSAGAAQAGGLAVAVAANFAAPMQKIATAFEQETGHRLALSFGSTGKFYAQIRHGAPFAVLLAADARTPARLAQEGLAIEASRFTYAVGQLVLWSKQPGLVDAHGEVLRSGSFRHLALADAKLAPYGAAAMQVLAQLGLVEALRGTFVQGESIGQAYQFVASGNAPLGFVALSQVKATGELAEGSVWRVPQALYDPIRQDAVLLALAQDNSVALAFLRYLRGDTARAIMEASGYDVPRSPA